MMEQEMGLHDIPADVVLENAPVGYALHKIICDLEGNPCDYEYVEMNSTFEKLTGMLASETIGHRVTEILPSISEGSFDWIAIYGDIALHNGEREFEQFSYQLKRWYRVKAFSPRKYYFVTYISDVSKEMAQLLELEQFSHMNLDLMGIAYCEGGFVKVNKVWKEVLGYSESEAEKTRYLDLVHPDDLAATALAIKGLDNEDATLDLPNRYRCKDGTYRHLEWRLKRYGNFMYAAARDITDKVEYTNIMRNMVMFSGELLQQSSGEIEYQKVTDHTLFIAKAKYAVLNLYNEDGTKFQTVAISAPKDVVGKASEILGHTFYDRQWDCFCNREDLFQGKQMVRFSCLYELAGTTFPKTSLRIIERLFHVGEIMMVKIIKDDQMIGDFTLIMSKGKQVENQDLIEIYTRQIGLLIARKDAEQKLEQSERLLRQSQRAANLGSYDIDLIGQTWNGTPELEEIFGIDNTHPHTTKGWLALVHPDNRDRVVAYYDNMKAQRQRIDVEYKIIRKNDGIERWVHGLGELILDQEGHPIRLIGTIQDITTRKRAEEQILYLSYYDKLTGLYNRRFFEEELKKADRAENLPISIIMGDANGLKLVNDFFGHLKGDELLKKAASTIKGACRKEDIVARWGGDEFVVLMLQTPSHVAERVVKSIKNHYRNASVGAVDISVSFGWDTKTRTDEELVKVLKNAEDYMYQHKIIEHKGTRSGLIDTIINTLHEKNPREEKHSKRVSRICQEIGKAVGLSEAEVSKIKMIGLLHDIGKIAIDESILNKPGVHTAKEREEMRRHPEIGYRILSSSYDMSQAAECILAHHEWWDGSGYPKGLKGEEIPKMARIIAIADSYDAMTSQRAYQEALSEHQALEEIRNGSGKQFDPQLAVIFVEKVMGKKW